MWEIKESKIQGQGAFAERKIKKGWIIGHAYDIMPGISFSGYCHGP